MKVNTTKNKRLDDDTFVEECMRLLTEQYPSIEGYTYERVDEDAIQLLIWGNLNIVGE